MAASFHVRNFGCRANQADGVALASALRCSGLQPAPEAAADWVVFNTCTVTGAADAEARRAIRKLHRQRPETRIAVTGCYAERAPAEIAALAGVAVVAGHAAQRELGERLAAGLARIQPQPPKLASLAQIEPERGERTRPVLKVQEGCGRACSFCIIPQVRGPNRSRALGLVLAEVEALAAAGHGELVVSGINLGQWGRDLDAGLGLQDLVHALLQQTRLRRLRLSSVEPMDWSAALTAAMAAHPGRFARHAHLPLQSGSDAVLRRMRRRYRARDYAGRAEALAARVPGVAIGTDVMAGFPDESEVEFAHTCDLISHLPLAYLHVFPFSPRPGTEAARQLATGAWRPVPSAVTAARVVELRRLGAAKRAAFLDTLVGHTLPAIVLGRGEALSDNYARLRLAHAAPPGTLIEARVLERQGEVLLAA
ncbi:MAG: MiaB/RimO family radical SAM methylthiotransferase [Terriglobales bacterium]